MAAAEEGTGETCPGAGVDLCRSVEIQAGSEQLLVYVVYTMEYYIDGEESSQKLVS